MESEFIIERMDMNCHICEVSKEERKEKRKKGGI